MAFRSSPYIDLDNGVVITPPMVLSQRLTRPLSSDDMLALFECRVDVWQLGPAVEILKYLDRYAPDPASVWAHGAHALLGLVFTYVEMIGKTLYPASKASGTAGRDAGAPRRPGASGSAGVKEHGIRPLGSLQEPGRPCHFRRRPAPVRIPA